MAEPSVREAALKHVAPSWDDARTERTFEGAQHKRARRRARNVLATSTLAVLVLGGGAFAALRVLEPAPPLAAKSAASIPGNLSFSDGSEAFLLDATSEVVVLRAMDAAIDVSLPKGHVRFEIQPRPERTFQVLCDDVKVRVLGTGFELQRAGARTHVRVLHGRVAVSWPDGAMELGAGEAGWFPRPKLAEPLEIEAPEVVEPAVRERARAASWRQHAERGEYQEAYRVLERDRPRVSDDVEELLLAADAARLSGHPSAAVPYLQRVVDQHAGDPRAPLAAFTLGGVLMNQLDRPREAGAAYARARAMSPSSALSQDALARQVEAAHAASDKALARSLALDYLERYPDGRRVQAVRRFGGLP
jgi:transmembrane sensor